MHMRLLIRLLARVFASMLRAQPSTDLPIAGSRTRQLGKARVVIVNKVPVILRRRTPAKVAHAGSIPEQIQTVPGIRHAALDAAFGSGRRGAAF